MEHPARILVVKAAGIGDLILAVPAFRALRHRFPDAAIDLLVTPKCADLMTGCPFVDAVHLLPTRGMHNRIAPSQTLPLVRTLWRLRRQRYDLLINLYHLFSRAGALKVRLLCRAIAPGAAIGRNTDHRGTFYDASVFDSWEDPSWAARHETALNLDVVRLLGAEDPGEGLAYWVDDAARARTASELERLDVAAGSFSRIILNPGADAPYKRWPASCFAELADRLLQEHAVQILITGGADDRPVVERILGAMTRRDGAVDLAGRLTLVELAALLERCDLIVTNDTGPMHLAAAVGTSVVALFGPGKPGRYGPCGPAGRHTVLQHPAACSPCTDFECRDRRCMEAISVEEVYRTVTARLVPLPEVCR